MREPAFLRSHKDQWLEYENLLNTGSGHLDADRLASLYTLLVDDLAYARTFYPRSKVIPYLNGLAARTHLLLYRRQRARTDRLTLFWTRELPLILYQTRRQIGYATLIFVLSALLGAVSALTDESFVRLIMGDGYVEMTLENIRQGDPMGVYKGEDPLGMFLRIAINNIMVSFLVFAMGVIVTFGTIFGIPFPPFNLQSGLFFNGVMVGAFMAFFQRYGLIWEAVPVIYIHGTLELSAIAIAGGAGFSLGNSILFPGTLPRRLAFQQGALDGVKILISLLPVFIMAAWLESYITRLTDMPLLLKLLIIFLSLGWIIGYYVIYPVRVFRQEMLRTAMPAGTSLWRPPVPVSADIS
ncbi:MAG: stage II sporulation protein M [Bacteroidia bacterium]|nr:stage II sporulation protein M [Bacteroidia bacterium]